MSRVDVSDVPSDFCNVTSPKRYAVATLCLLNFSTDTKGRAGGTAVDRARIGEGLMFSRVTRQILAVPFTVSIVHQPPCESTGTTATVACKSNQSIHQSLLVASNRAPPFFDRSLQNLGVGSWYSRKSQRNDCVCFLTVGRN